MQIWSTTWTAPEVRTTTRLNQEANDMAGQQQPDLANEMADLNLELEHRPDAVMYHVTNIEGNAVNQYEHLQINIADDETYDGLLVGLPVVFFTTTLYSDRGVLGLPTISTYPRARGGVRGQEYKRVSVPLRRFQNYDWWEMRKGSDQVRLLFTNEHWSTILSNAIGPIPLNRVDKQCY